MYRSLLAKKIFGDIRIIPSPVCEPDLCRETWRGRALIKNEMHFIIEHARAGLIDDKEASQTQIRMN